MNTASIERFISHLCVVPSGCWMWTGCRDRHGYGKTANGHNSFVRANRLAWILFRGDPAGKMVCHKCDHPSCVNPSHLFLGSATDNAADMMYKKRHVGPTPWRMGKLNSKTAGDIRMLFKRGFTRKELASMYRVDRSHICNILLGKAYSTAGGRT